MKYDKKSFSITCPQCIATDINELFCDICQKRFFKNDNSRINSEELVIFEKIDINELIQIVNNHL